MRLRWPCFQTGAPRETDRQTDRESVYLISAVCLPSMTDTRPNRTRLVHEHFPSSADHVVCRSTFAIQIIPLFCMHAKTIKFQINYFSHPMNNQRRKATLPLCGKYKYQISYTHSRSASPRGPLTRIMQFT